MSKCMKRCCVVSRMYDDLCELLEKEFPKRKQFKVSGVTTNSDQVNIHIDEIVLNYSFLKKLEKLHYSIINVWTQAHLAISLAVIPDEGYLND